MDIAFTVKVIDIDVEKLGNLVLEKKWSSGIALVSLCQRYMGATPWKKHERGWYKYLYSILIQQLVGYPSRETVMDPGKSKEYDRQIIVIDTVDTGMIPI